MKRRTKVDVENNIQYFCYWCNSWVNTFLQNVDGYTDVVCTICDYTIIEDFYRFKDIEDELNDDQDKPNLEITDDYF